MKSAKKTGSDRNTSSESAMRFDDVLKRMLSSPPKPHVKPKPAAKTAQKKPAN